jgi:hypothetical protein
VIIALGEGAVPAAGRNSGAGCGAYAGIFFCQFVLKRVSGYESLECRVLQTKRVLHHALIHQLKFQRL